MRMTGREGEDTPMGGRSCVLIMVDCRYLVEADAAHQETALWTVEIKTTFFLLLFCFYEHGGQKLMHGSYEAAQINTSYIC